MNFHFDRRTLTSFHVFADASIVLRAVFFVIYGINNESSQCFFAQRIPRAAGNKRLRYNRRYITVLIRTSS